jgi:hypothetical protein
MKMSVFVIASPVQALVSDEEESIPSQNENLKFKVMIKGTD